MIAKILVPLDGSQLSEQILPYFRIVAEGFQAGIQLLKVKDPEITPPFWPPLQGKDYLLRVRTVHLLSPLQVDCRVQVGKPADIITGWNKGDAECLIAMATHGVAGARRWLLGSVTSKVVQTATHPLLLVRPKEDCETVIKPELKTVLVGLDGSELAESVLPYVSAFAKRLNLAVILLRVYEIPIDALQIRGKDFAQLLAQRKALLQKEAEEYLEVKAQPLRGNEIAQLSTLAVEGHPASAIIDRAEKSAGSLIALATHGRSGLGRRAMGSVADRVVHSSGKPVFLVRPA